MTYKEIESKYEIEVFALYELEEWITNNLWFNYGYLDDDVDLVDEKVAEIIDDEYKHLTNDHYISNEDYEKLVDNNQLEEVIYHLEH